VQNAPDLAAGHALNELLERVFDLQPVLKRRVKDAGGEAFVGGVDAALSKVLVQRRRGVRLGSGKSSSGVQRDTRASGPGRFRGFLLFGFPVRP
jgi:hypothetical protein